MIDRRWSITLAAVVLVGGCAQQGAVGPEAGGGRPGEVRVEAGDGRPGGVRSEAGDARPGEVRVEASVAVSAGGGVPASALPLAPGRPGAASCARGAVPTVDPSASFDVRDPAQRARRALAEQHRATPRRGVVAAEAAAGAEACVHALRIHFSLLASGAGSGAEAVEEALRAAGLAKVRVTTGPAEGGPTAGGPAFAGSTGAACVYGAFHAAGPEFSIGPLLDGAC